MQLNGNQFDTDRPDYYFTDMVYDDGLGFASLQQLAIILKKRIKHRTLYHYRKELNGRKKNHFWRINFMNTTVKLM